MSLTLVVLAAGIGSRYGGLKQIDGVGPSSEAVLDYSLFDAQRAGFDHVVFVIRRDIEAAFRAHFGAGFGRGMKTDYVFQEMDTDVPPDLRPAVARAKPWGTGHAVLCCRGAARHPFAVINADDFYGHDAYRIVAGYLRGLTPGATNHALVGFEMRQTLSPHGAVSRAVCGVDPEGWLTSIEEVTRIEDRGGRIGVTAESGSAGKSFTGREPVSMNLWGFAPSVFSALTREFREFLRTAAGNPRAEFFLPTVVSTLISRGEARFRVLQTPGRWFGITYPADRPTVSAAIRALVTAGEYPQNARF